MPESVSAAGVDAGRATPADARPSAADGGRFALLLACFFLSGLTALIYQTAWTREFSFVFGATELAVTTVLAAYMGGLALGAALAGILAPRIVRPVLVYAVLELGIAISALLVPAALRGARALYVASFGGDPEALSASGGLDQTLFYLVCSFVILLIPTTLMGATLPLLAGYAVRSEREVGSRIGALYSINTAGAVVGTLCAAFVLLPALGLRSTIWIAVALNGLVFVAAAGLARGGSGASSAAPKKPVTSIASHGRLAWILPMILISGVCSFIYEVMWVRLLGHVIGGSVYAFATMLASFLIGIALGSSVAARIATNVRRAVIGFGISQLGIAGLSVAAFVSIGWISDSMVEQLSAPGATGSIVVVSMATLLPAALCIGATFPFAVRIMARGSEDASLASARVYSWNTVGSIVGSILAGFVLLPMLEFAGTLQLAACLNLALAVAVSLVIRVEGTKSTASSSSSPVLRRLVAGLGVIALVSLLILAPVEPWSIVRRTPLSGRVARGEVIYYALGRGATVLLVDEVGRYRLSTNGLPESAIGLRGEPVGRLVVAAWLGNLPGLLRPDAKSMLVVGLGGGVMIEHVPGTIEEINVIELESEVLEANRLASSVRARDPLSDPRVTVTINDARTALMISGRQFDSIISQPSHPWTAGSSHLYTRDFFQLASDHLTDEGVLVQWMGMGFVDAELFRVLLATLNDVFPHVQVYAPAAKGFLFVASKSPIDALASAARALEAEADHYGVLGVTEPQDVLSAMLLDSEGSRRFAQGAEVSTDDFNILQTRSPKIRGKGIDSIATAMEIVGDLDFLQPPPDGIDALHLIRKLVHGGRTVRAEPIAKSLDDERERAIAMVIVGLVNPTLPEIDRLQELIAKYPDDAELRALVLRLKFPAERNRWSWLPGPSEPHSATEARVVLAATLAGNERWDELEALDSALAEIAPADPNYRLAVRLRVLWRTARHEPERAREALALLDGLAGGSPNVRVLLERAALGEVAGQPGVVLRNTLDAIQRMKKLPVPLLRAARARVARVAQTSEFAGIRAVTLVRLDKRIARRQSGRAQ